MNTSRIALTTSALALTALVASQVNFSRLTAFAEGPVTGPITAPITSPIDSPTPTPSATPEVTPTATPTPTTSPTSTPKPTHSPKPTSTPKPKHDKEDKDDHEDLMHGRKDDDRGHKFQQVINRWVESCRGFFSRISHR